MCRVRASDHGEHSMTDVEPPHLRAIRLSCFAGLLGALAVGATSGTLMSIAGSGDGFFARLTWTSVVVMLGSTVGMIMALIMKGHRLRVAMRLGLFMAAVAVVGGTVLIWANEAMGYATAGRLVRIVTTLGVLALGLALTGHVATISIRLGVLRLARAGVLMVGWLTVGLVLMMTWTEWWFWYVEILSVIAAVAGAASLVGVVVLPRLAGQVKARAPESMPGRLRLEMTCPKCNTDQVAGTGLHRCPSCGLRAIIEVEEPRCGCGYLLYRLAGDQCPECGREISAADQWLARRDDSTAPLGSRRGNDPSA